MEIFQDAGNYRIIAVYDTPLRTIEDAGRTCYRSEEKITEESADTFVRMLRRRGHEAMIEHSFMTVEFNDHSRGFTHELVRHRLAAFGQESTRYVDESDFQFVLPPTMDRMEIVLELDINEYQKKMGKAATNQVISLVHSDLLTLKKSIESVSYKLSNIQIDDNFISGQLGIQLGLLSDITKSLEPLLDRNKIQISIEDWIALNEQVYRNLRKNKHKPENARQFLPIGITSKIVMSANFREWRHVFKMRCDWPAHWEIRRTMVNLLKECIQRWPAVFDDFEYRGEFRGLEYWNNNPNSKPPKKKKEES